MMSAEPVPRRRAKTPRARTALSRLALNATLAGAWAAGILALLVFFIDADLPLTPANYAPVAVCMIAFLAPASGLAWALAAGAVRLFAAFRVRTPWIGFRPFWRFLVADLALLAIVFARNLSEAREYLPAEMVEILTGATILLGTAAALFCVDALWRGITRRRLATAPLLVAALLLTGGLFGLRERYRLAPPAVSASVIEPPRPAAPLLLIGIDGASPEDLLPRVAEGRLHHLSALLAAGSTAPLSSPLPPRPTAAWASVLTGHAPAAHGRLGEVRFAPILGDVRISVVPSGVGFAALVGLGLMREVPLEAARSAVPTLDHLLSRSGYEVRVAGWPAWVSPSAGGVPGLHPPDAASLPPDVIQALAALERHQERAEADPAGSRLSVVLAEALRVDLEAGVAILGDGSPPGPASAWLVRLAGLDRVMRHYLRYHLPDRFGNVSDEEIERYGDVIPDYYRFVDAWVGALVARVAAPARVIVLSPYGVRPVEIGERMRIALSGDPAVSGTHLGGGPGLLLAAGPGLRAGGRLERAEAWDVTPTILYLADLPVGWDMEGEPLTSMASEEFAAEHPVAAVPSWETVSLVSPGFLP